MMKRTQANSVRCWAAAGVLMAAILVGAVFSAHGGTALDVRYGNPAAFLMPEINAMGGTGAAVYRGGLSNVLNPAFLIYEENLRFDGALSLEQVHEDRFVPLFDSFQSYVTDTAIASNRHHYFGTGFGMAKRIGSARPLIVVAASLTDRYDYTYDFEEEIRDPDSFSDPRDAVIQERKVEVDGKLRALSGGMAVALRPEISLGATIHYVFGDREDILRVRDLRTPDNSSLTQTAFDVDGIHFTVGGRAQLNERVEVGLAYETPLEVDGNQISETMTGQDPAAVLRSAGRETVTYPRRFRGGFAYHPRSEPRTVFTVDAVYSEWSDLDDSRTEEDGPARPLEDTMDVRIGLEHRFYNDTTMHAGFRHMDSYTDREASASTFSLGVGLPVAAGHVAASVELSKITSIQEHWFPYDLGNGFFSEDESRVEDTRFRLGFGFSRSF